MKLSKPHEAFVLHWGDMGSRWGVNRTTAQVHALLLVSEAPIHAAEICELLEIARSNVSVALRELQTWGLVHTNPQKGDRKDHFEAEKSVWKVLIKIADKRLEREIKPTLEFLKELKQEVDSKSSLFKLLQEFIGIFESSLRFYERIKQLPRGVVTRILKLDQKLTKLAGA